MQRLLSTVAILHKYLQSENLDLSKALQFKDAVLQTLINMRSTETAEEIYDQMEAMLKENHLETARALPKRNKRKKLDDFYVTTSTGQRDEISDSESMRTKLFYPAIDRMIGEMRERFSPQCENVMVGINACSPSMESFLNLEDLKRLATHYKLDMSEPEVAVAKNFIKAVQLTSE